MAVTMVSDCIENSQTILLYKDTCHSLIGCNGESVVVKRMHATYSHVYYLLVPLTNKY